MSHTVGASIKIKGNVGRCPLIRYRIERVCKQLAPKEVNGALGELKHIRDRKRCAGVFSAIVLFAVLVAPAEHSLLDSQSDLPQHRPVEFKYDLQGRKVREPVSNAATTSAFSGYQAPAGFYTQASLQWTVPSVTYGPSTGSATQYSSNWVGIQGNSSTLVQLGTDQSVSSTGAASYYAWYQLYPQSAYPIPLPLKPGDLISASLSCADPCTANTTQMWTLWMQNATQGWTWTKAFAFNNGPSNYAEWILEAPYSAGVLPLANYAISTFASVAANNGVPNLSSSNALVMQDPYGQTSNASPYQAGNFVTCWGYGSMTPCGSGTLFTPTASVAASPQTIQSTQTSTLTWGSTNATSCTGEGFDTAGATSGSAVVAPLASTTYSISCSGSGGSGGASTTVTVKTQTACHGRGCK